MVLTKGEKYKNLGLTEDRKNEWYEKHNKTWTDSNKTQKIDAKNYTHL